MNRLSHVNMAFNREPAVVISDLLSCQTRVRRELVH